MGSAVPQEEPAAPCPSYVVPLGDRALWSFLLQPPSYHLASASSSHTPLHGPWRWGPQPTGTAMSPSPGPCSENGCPAGNLRGRRMCVCTRVDSADPCDLAFLAVRAEARVSRLGLTVCMRPATPATLRSETQSNTGAGQRSPQGSPHAKTPAHLCQGLHMLPPDYKGTNLPPRLPAGLGTAPSSQLLGFS